MDELSKTVPTNAYLSNLRYRSGNVEIQGSAENASALIPILERSPLFENVGFNAPSNRGRDNRETFSLKADIEKAKEKDKQTMNQFWQRLSKRERGLVVLSLVIIFVGLARYLLIGPFVERWEWVRSQLEIQPQLLEKNLRFLGQKEELVAMLEATQNELKAKEPRVTHRGHIVS